MSTGQQPLFNEDGSVVVVFNGEIYNYQELIPELAALGHVFRTQSDTEVIVHAWEAWGEDCVERFRGMFAFALWDRNRETLFLARDRLGVKPLYYALLDDGTLLFGSELKSLLAHGGLRRDIDPLAVEEYFALGYVAEPRTIFRQARKLPPAHTLLHPPRRSRCRAPREYWDVRFTLDSADRASRTPARSWSRGCDESVRLRMISEVPLGAFLSGGVDSSAVVATMAGLSAEPVNTCSIAFDDPAFDESRVRADRWPTATARGTPSRRSSSDDFDLIDTLARALRRAVRRQLGDPDLPRLPARAQARDRRAVGRRRRRELRRLSALPPAPDGRADARGAAARRAPAAVRPARARSIRRPTGRRACCAPRRPSRRWRATRSRPTSTAMSILRGPHARRGCSAPRFKRRARRLQRAATCSSATPRSAGTDDPLALIQYLDLKTYLVGDINTKVDRASMAHSLEVREPLMDHLLVEWLATLPSSLKMRGGEGKYLLKKAMEPHLPRDVLYRPEDGLRGAARALVPRAAARSACATRCSASALAGTGWFDRALPRAPGRRAPVRRARPQRAAVDAADVRGVPAQRGRRSADAPRQPPARRLA